MSKIIIVPDVHGRTFWRLAKEKINEIDRVVFLGDYLDPYPIEGISPEKAIEELKKIIDFKKRIPREGYFVDRESRSSIYESIKRNTSL